MGKLKTHYSNLQVAENASIEVIRGAYKYLSQKYHPDKHSKQREKAERIMRVINAAYVVLSDPVRRKEHDIWIKGKREEIRRMEEEDTYSHSKAELELELELKLKLEQELKLKLKLEQELLELEAEFESAWSAALPSMIEGAELEAGLESGLELLERLMEEKRDEILEHERGRDARNGKVAIRELKKKGYSVVVGFHTWVITEPGGNTKKVFTNNRLVNYARRNIGIDIEDKLEH